jgi:hypothetical protein
MPRPVITSPHKKSVTLERGSPGIAQGSSRSFTASMSASEDHSAGNDGARGRQRYGDQTAQRADAAAERALGRGPEW